MEEMELGSQRRAFGMKMTSFLFLDCEIFRRLRFTPALLRTIRLLSHRPTCRSFRGSCSTAPGWPSRTRLSTWPSTSSCCWTRAPPPQSTPLNSCWMSTRTERGELRIGRWNKTADCFCVGPRLPASGVQWMSYINSENHQEKEIIKISAYGSLVINQ